MKNKELVNKIFAKINKNLCLLYFQYNKSYEQLLVNDYIMSKEFLKAFFGEEKEGWRYHAQQMVIEEEPLEYLERFLN